MTKTFYVEIIFSETIYLKPLGFWPYPTLSSCL